MRRLFALQFHHILKRTITNDLTILGQRSSIFNVTTRRNVHDDATKLSEKKEIVKNDKPTKEQLLAIDWIAESLVPKLFKEPLRQFYHFCLDDVIFNDQIFGYNFVGKSNLQIHIAKVRSYFRYKSPFNKCVHKGSVIFENDNFITILWQINTLDSSWKTYVPFFITKAKSNERIIEGALELYINNDGRIFKIVNRKVTDIDKTEAEKLNLLKKKQITEEEKEERKKIEKQIKDMYKN